MLFRNLFGFNISLSAVVAGSSGGPSCPEIKNLNVSEFKLNTQLPVPPDGH